MTADTETISGPRATKPVPPGDFQVTYRPGHPSNGVGRWLRGFAGIIENVLDWVPEERPRYTLLGIIILNTGLLAGLSMMIALTKIHMPPWPFLILAGLVWGFVIVSFDRWVITSTHGAAGGAKLRIFFPRLLITILMGITIAEPLLLYAFGPDIETEASRYQHAELISYASKFRICNPETGGTVKTASCHDFHLTVKDSPVALEAQLQQAISQRKQLRQQVDRINATLQRKEDLANNECAGKSGPGLTGQAGDGPECLRDRHMADQYRKDSRLSEHQSDLTTLDRTVSSLTGRLSAARRGYDRELSAAIKAKVQEKRDSQHIGLIEEEDALGRLASRSNRVQTEQWVVRLLLIALDCLPALTKMLSGTTTYDVMVARQRDVGKRLHDKKMTLRERGDAVFSDLGLQQTEHDFRTQSDRINQADRTHRAASEVDKDTAIEKLAAELRAQGRGQR